MAKPKASESTEPVERRGRPPKEGVAKTSNLNMRVTEERRAGWRASAAACGQDETEWVTDGLDVWMALCQRRDAWQAAAAARGQDDTTWVREALDAWATFCARAAQLGSDPHELVELALSDHARVRAAIAELARGRSRGRRDSDS